MKMFAHAASRRLSRYGLLATVVAVAVAVPAVSPKSDANAESGRRICHYSFKAKPRDYSDPLMRISIGLDYKKDGACPAVSADRLAATGYVDKDQIYPNPVEKWTCEDWGRTHSLYLTDLGSDPCPAMLNDHLYAFFWQDPTTPNAAKPSYQDLGYWTDFQ